MTLRGRHRQVNSPTALQVETELILLKAEFEAHSELGGHPGIGRGVCVVGADGPVPGSGGGILVRPALGGADRLGTRRGETCILCLLADQ